MKIEFLLPNNNIVSNPYQFGEFRDDNTFNYYLHLKALEYNKKVVNDMKSLREEEGIDSARLRFEVLGAIQEVLEHIPKGPTLFTSDSLYIELLDKFLKDSKYSDLNTLGHRTNTIFSYLNLNNTYDQQYIKPYTLVEILLFDMVTVKCPEETLPSIYWVPNVHDTGLKSIDIRLNAYMPKQRLHEYIDKVYDTQIKPALKAVKIQEEDTFLLTKRDIYIIEARRKGVKFKYIADLLEKEGLDSETNEDMVKSAHRRAMTKVRSL